MPRARDMQHHIVGCEPRPNNRNISTRHIATLLRIIELNSTFKESNVKKITFTALFEEKYSLLSMSEIILILQDILEKYSIISFLHTVHISFSYTCQYKSEPPTSDKIDISLQKIFELLTNVCVAIFVYKKYGYLQRYQNKTHSTEMFDS